MRRQEHHERAMELLAKAHVSSPEYAIYLVGVAQVHATLAKIPDNPMQDREVTHVLPRRPDPNIGAVSQGNDALSNIIQLSGWQVRHDVRASDGATVYTIRVGDGSYVKLTRDQFFVNPGGKDA